MRTPTIVAACLLYGMSHAAPRRGLLPRSERYAVDIIKDIMPDSVSCDGAPVPAQCRTAEQAAPHFIDAMAKYEIYDSWEIAAVLSLTAMESVSMKYNEPANQANNPDKGKGTSNMQSGTYNLMFAKSFPELASKLTAIIGSSDSSALTDSQKAQVLELLQQDDYNFHSGAWFLSSQCSADIRSGIRAGTQQGWLNYVLNCVGVPAETADSKSEWDKRKAYWQSAMTAFGLQYTQ